MLNAHDICCDRHVGGIGLIWCVAFGFLVYESPDVHPRISREEYEYISDQMGPELRQQLSQSVSISDLLQIVKLISNRLLFIVC